MTGFFFGMGFLSLGVSWIHVSIHSYGHLNTIVSAFITLLFVAYLALFPGLGTLCYQAITSKRSLLFNCFLFSATWCLSEYLRATALSGFPWLLLGYGQIDSPLRHLMPIVGIYGVSFIACLAATLLATGMQAGRNKRYLWIVPCISLIIGPSLLKNLQWTTTSTKPISVGVIQANISMRDKWDESLFWKILQRYETAISDLMGKTQVIVLPESAIPVPVNYVSDILEGLDHQAKTAGSAILLGIPQPTTVDNTAYYNTLTTLGAAQGTYLKQHLVPFGEFIPGPFQKLVQWLSLPAANLRSGRNNQPLIAVQNHPVASLICYEIAYPNLLRKQLPEAQWIVAISDDGWFGHSLAMHQQLQMSQALSLITGRYQIVANNDGLSSVIDNQGHIVASLPTFTSDVLEANIYPSTNASPWVKLGDWPTLLISFLLVFIGLLLRQYKKLI